MPVHAIVKTLGFSIVPHVTSVAGNGASNALPFQNCLYSLYHLFFFGYINYITAKDFFQHFSVIFYSGKILYSGYFF